MVICPSSSPLPGYGLPGYGLGLGLGLGVGLAQYTSPLGLGAKRDVRHAIKKGVWLNSRHGGLTIICWVNTLRAMWLRTHMPHHIGLG